MLQGHDQDRRQTGPLFRYDIEVENGITGIDLHAVRRRSSTRRSSTRAAGPGTACALQRVDSGPIDFHVTLTSVDDGAQVLRLRHPGRDVLLRAAPATSGLPVNRVVLNDARWVRGAAAYVGDLAAYRIYMINHEDGHALGHKHAHECLPGGLAPVMMQQTIGLKSAVTGKMLPGQPVAVPAGREGRAGCRAAGHRRRTTSTTSATDPPALEIASARGRNAVGASSLGATLRIVSCPCHRSWNPPSR